MQREEGKEKAMKERRNIKKDIKIKKGGIKRKLAKKKRKKEIQRRKIEKKGREK